MTKGEWLGLMPQLTRCPHCQRELKIPDGAAGNLQCPLCKKIFAVRAAPARVPVAAVAASESPARSPNGPRPASVAPTRPVPASSSRIAPVRPPASLHECPACKAKLLPGAAACLECGYMVRDGAPMESEETPNLCPNPACGVANPVGERICQRCSGPLPYPQGTVLHGRYRIEKLLAIGGFAAVYLATDQKQNNLQVALKDMLCGDAGEFNIRLNFFQREALILKAMSGLPAVPRYHDFIHKGQSAHLLLEYINGQDLQKILDSNGSKPFDFEQVVEWSKSICDVLQHMHTMTPPL